MFLGVWKIKWKVRQKRPNYQKTKNKRIKCTWRNKTARLRRVCGQHRETEITINLCERRSIWTHKVASIFRSRVYLLTTTIKVAPTEALLRLLRRFYCPFLSFPRCPRRTSSATRQTTRTDTHLQENPATFLLPG